MALRRIWSKVKAMSESLKINVLPNASSVKTIPTNATYATASVRTKYVLLRQVAHQLGSMEVLLHSCDTEPLAIA